MRRLCRLKTASHGDDGKWAYDEIVSLREQCDELRAQLAAAQEEIQKLRLDLLTSYGESEELSGQLSKAEQRVAEAIHDMTDEVCAPLQTDDKSIDYWHGVGSAAVAIENAIVAFEWRKFVKEM